MKTRVAGLAIAAMAGIVPAAQAETFQFASAFSPTDAFTLLVEDWSAQVSEATGGSVRFEVVPNGALVPLPEALDAISFGVVPAGMVVASFTSGTIPALGYTEMLGGLPLDNPPTGEALAAIWPDLDALFADHGATALWGAPAFSSGIVCRTGFLRSPADWQGLKIRTAGRWQARQVAAMGAVPTPLPPSELYVALQNGVVDCALMTPSITMSTRLYEVAPYYTDTNLPGNITISILNLDTWNGFTDAERAAIREVSDQMLQTASVAMRESAEAGLVELGRLGEVYALSDEERAALNTLVDPVFDEVAASITGGPAAAVISALAAYR